MELRHLRYFIAVAEEENVTRAAARLHISQPPLTRQIHDLEDEIGVALFDRKGKTIRLTRAGGIFLKEARQVLQRVEDAVKRARNVSGEKIEFRIGYAPSPTVEVLPTLLKEFEHRFPNVNVTVHDSSSPEMLAGLRSGQLHAAVMMEPAKAAARGISFIELREYRVGLAVDAKHALAKRRAVAVEDIRKERQVAYSRRQFPDYHEFLKRRLGRAATKLKLALECDSGASLVAAVESGKGVCITGEFLVKGVGHRLKFVPIEPAPEPATVVLAYISKQKGALGRAIEELVRASESVADARS